MKLSVFAVFLVLSSSAWSQARPTGAVKESPEEYNRRLEKCKVDSQAAPPAQNSTPTNNTKPKSTTTVRQ